MGYLLISRRINERILIGDDIEILISDIDNGRVDVAVKAPKSYSIKRKVTHCEEIIENRNKFRQVDKRS